MSLANNPPSNTELESNINDAQGWNAEVMYIFRQKCKRPYTHEFDYIQKWLCARTREFKRNTI